MRRFGFVALITALVTLVAGVGAAQAVVVKDSGNTAGVALEFGTRAQLGSVGVSTVPHSGACSDPWLSTDLNINPNAALCSGGSVLHNNEPFALTWDLPTPNRRHWETTRQYMQQFLRDVADGSSNLGTPYAVTSQYRDGGGRANDSSLYGGGCTDLGAAGGFTCDFGDSTGSGAGNDYPAAACAPTGSDPVHLFVDGSIGTAANDTCLTDAQIRNEVSAASAQINGHVKPGYSPLVVVMTPPGVVDCLDSPGAGTAGKLCSANGTLGPPTPVLSTATTGGSVPAGVYTVELTYQTPSGETPPSGEQSILTVGSNSTVTVDSPPAEGNASGYYVYISQGNGAFTRQGGILSIGQNFTLGSSPSGGAAAPAPVPAFCSYHSEVNGLPYVVVPWTPLTGCKEPDAPTIDLNNLPSVDKLAQIVGAQLVSPLSQAHIAALTDPALNGWVALDGSEVNDNNGCHPLDKSRDVVTIGSSTQNPYYLQREWNNAAAIESDPNALGCTGQVLLSPQFVVPSAINAGDLVELDGSTTASTLIVPKANYQWNFGDGTTAVGPSVVHSYSKGGNYTVTLTVTDRGGNVRSLSQVINVLGHNGQVVSPTGSSGGLHARIQLLPQGLHSLLSKGLRLRVTSSEAADGIATVRISRKLARRAHIKLGHGATVVIGRGTVRGIADGTVDFRVRVASAIVKKLKALGHVTLTVRLTVFGTDHTHVTLDAAGRY